MRPRLSQLRSSRWHHSAHEPVLGTRLDLRVQTTSARVARSIADDCLTEIDRLENIFSAFRPGSDFNHWRIGTDATLTHTEYPELTTVLTLAEQWMRITNGLFNPGAELLTQRWKTAEKDGKVPTVDELAKLCNYIHRLPYTTDPLGDIHRTDDCTMISVHAIAKGWIADRAAEVVAGDERVHGVVVNIGGDVRVVGNDPVPIAIENPLRAYDNEPPIDRIQIQHGLATSGGSRRGFTINGDRYSHVIDPRTGITVNHAASVSVFAPNAATADVMATALSVVAPNERSEVVRTVGTAILAAAEAIGFLVVEPSGLIVTNEAWDHRRFSETH